MLPQHLQFKQLGLFGQEQLPQPQNGAKAAFNDPAFASNKTLPLHRWVPWIAGFSSAFVRDALDTSMGGKGIVLDPFAGVGTTLIEAVLAGHDAIGFEINPYAALACRTKAQAYMIDPGVLSEMITAFRTFYHQRLQSGSAPHSEPPKGFKTRGAFYSPPVLYKVLIVQDFIRSVKNQERIQDLFRLAFAATMVTYSNYSYEPSLGQRVSAGKANIDDFPVDELLIRKLAEMLNDIQWFRMNVEGTSAQTHVFNASFFQCGQYLSPDSVDAVITSPPYLNNYHYNRNTRPHLYWLDYVKKPEDMRGLEQSNFGKYWQTVRDHKLIDLSFSLPDTSLSLILKELRSLNTHRGIYGGNGWANYAASYFNDCYAFVNCLKYVLKPGCMALVVIGNSILQGIPIATDQYFGQIAESVGLELISVDIPRSTRVGNSIIQSDVRVAKAQASHQLYEAVVTLKKN